jgi:transcriptional regulator with XRE-family HTH domain
MRNDEIAKVIGNNIRKTLRNKIMTQREASETCNIEQGLLSRYICGIRTPNCINLVRLCAGLKTDPNTLLKGTYDKMPLEED